MNDRLGNKEVSKYDGNIRYYGANPNNYIDIGDSNGNIFFWRIIGVFKDIEVTDENENVIKTEDLVKIIRADSLTVGNVYVFSWNYTSLGEYDNNWSDSTLQVMLNDEVNGYYSSGITNYYNNSTNSIALNFVSTGLSNEVRRKVERVNWSFGGHNTTQIYTDAIYGYERAGTNIWSGKIALIYVSDYGYAADLIKCNSILMNYNESGCVSTNWMTKSSWTLIPVSSNSTNAFSIGSVGRVYNNGSLNLKNTIYPVLYLKSDVSIVEEK